MTGQEKEKNEQMKGVVVVVCGHDRPCWISRVNCVCVTEIDGVSWEGRA